MDNEIFASMQAQLAPSPEAAEGLRRRLAEALPRRRRSWRYAALAACAALAVLAYPVYRLARPEPGQRLHSFSYSASAGMATTPASSVEGLPGQDAGGDAPADSPGVDPAALDRLFVAQEGALEAYNDLMDHFGAEFRDGRYQENYPDWYGGGYLDWSPEDGVNGVVEAKLKILLVEPELPEDDKSLLLQIGEWAGGGDVLVFGSAKYSLSYLLELQERACDAMIELGLLAGCGVDEKENRLDMELTAVTDEALAILAGLDPEDDAIRVEVGMPATLAAEDLPAARPSSTRDGDPAGYSK